MLTVSGQSADESLIIIGAENSSISLFPLTKNNAFRVVSAISDYLNNLSQLVTTEMLSPKAFQPFTVFAVCLVSDCFPPYLDY